MSEPNGQFQASESGMLGSALEASFPTVAQLFPNDECFEQLQAPPPPILTPQLATCVGCAQTIIDRYFLAVADQLWHVDCLKCCLCQQKLEKESSCFWREGSVFCRHDYYNQFTKRCARCDQSLSSKDLVMKARELIYHLRCFKCTICESSLHPGDCFALGDHAALYCQNHYESMLSASEQEPSTSLQPIPLPEQILNDACRETLRADRDSDTARLMDFNNEHNQTSNDYLGMTSVSTSPDRGDEGSASPGMDGNSRNKRMRTSFKHHQLRTMKAYFGLNHNPDAKDLKQLAQKTGLTKRVLQVWFQNARAKYRRATHMKHGHNSLHMHGAELAATLSELGSPLSGGSECGPSSVQHPQHNINNNSAQGSIRHITSAHTSSDDLDTGTTDQCNALANYFSHDSNMLLPPGPALDS